MASTTPSDLLQLPALPPLQFLEATTVPLDAPNAYTVVDVLKSNQDQLWAAGPMEEAWYWIPVARVVTLKPIDFGKEKNPRKLLCEVVFTAQ